MIPLITRIFRVRIRPELRSEFEEKFHTVSVPAVRGHAGLVSTVVGRPTRWAPDEYVMISVWEKETDLESFAGKSWNQAVIPLGMEKFVDKCWVHHYENF